MKLLKDDKHCLYLFDRRYRLYFNLDYIVDNFELIRTLLKFKSKDDFYFIQILHRSKDNPEIGDNNRLVKSYYIRSLGHFDSKKNEIKQVCKLYKARAYIHLTKRSYKDVFLVCLQNLVERIRYNQVALTA